MTKKRQMNRMVDGLTRRRLSKWKWRVWFNDHTEVWDFKARKLKRT